MELPFYYEVKFNLLAFDEQNNTTTQAYNSIHSNSDDLYLNRVAAFEQFEEYLSMLKSNNRLQMENGNYKILQPKSVNDLIKRKHNEEYFDWTKRIAFYQESISVNLIIKSTEAIEKLELEADIDFELLEKGEFAINESPPLVMTIHKVASFIFEEQNLVDNLDLAEVPLYREFQYDINDKVVTVYHYGLDYSESGEDISGCERVILPTPFCWNTIEIYEKDYNKDNDTASQETNDGFDIKNVIEAGESHTLEFKPSLLFHFEKLRKHYIPQYNVAKTICGFLNSSGGVLIIGIDDKSGKIQGIQADYSLFHTNPKDKVLLAVDELLVNFFGRTVQPYIEVRIITTIDGDVLLIAISPSEKPIFLRKTTKELDKYVTEKQFFIRMNASTHQLFDTEEIIEYFFNKWGDKN